MEPSRRPWFQLHLSTYLALILLAAVLWGFYLLGLQDVFEYATSRAGLSWEGMLRFFRLISPEGAFILIVCPILMFVSVGYICENSIREQERKRQ